MADTLQIFWDKISKVAGQFFFHCSAKKQQKKNCEMYVDFTANREKRRGFYKFIFFTGAKNIDKHRK